MHCGGKATGQATRQAMTPAGVIAFLWLQNGLTTAWAADRTSGLHGLRGLLLELINPPSSFKFKPVAERCASEEADLIVALQLICIRIGTYMQGMHILYRTESDGQPNIYI